MSKISRQQSTTLTQRQRRVGEEVRHLLSSCLVKDDFHIEGFDTACITVTEVRMSADLKHAYAYVMPLGGKKVEEALVVLKGIAPSLRTFLAKKLRLRTAPSLHFEADKTFDEVDRLEGILRSDHVAQDLSS